MARRKIKVETTRGLLKIKSVEPVVSDETMEIFNDIKEARALVTIGSKLNNLLKIKPLCS
jgi:hypothetical protein